jgi:hypothetical protein
VVVIDGDVGWGGVEQWKMFCKEKRG